MRWYLRAIVHCVFSWTFVRAVVQTTVPIVAGWGMCRAGWAIWWCYAAGTAVALLSAVVAAIMATRMFFRAKREAQMMARVVEGVQKEFDRAAAPKKQPDKAN